MQTGFIILFFVLFAMAWGWIVAIEWYFHRLRTQHPALYSELGEPSLFWNNSVNSIWRFSKYLFSGKWRDLDDNYLVVASAFMRTFFVLYLVLFIVLVVVMPISFSPK